MSKSSLPVRPWTRVASLAGLVLSSPALAAQQGHASPAPAPQAFAPTSSTLAWADFDGDGLLDAVGIGADGVPHVLRNAGDGSLEEVALAAGEPPVRTTFALWSDRDRDGRFELLLGTESGRPRLLAFVDGAFQDLAPIVGLEHEGADYSATWIDYDQDGFVDLQMMTSSGPQLYHSLGDAFERMDLGAFGLTASVAAGPSVRPSELAEEDAPSGSVDDLPEAYAGGHLDAADPDIFPPERTGAPVVVQGGQSTSAGSGMPAMPAASCVPSIADQATSACLTASSLPVLGALYPLSNDFFVDEATGNVGLGTTSPTAGLHVDQDGSILAEGIYTQGVIPVEGPGTRMMWYPGKGALRAGSVNDTQWDDINIGLSSIAMGVNSTASGVSSSVLGGNDSLAQGGSSTVAGGGSNAAIGDRSIVAGGAFNGALGDSAATLGGQFNLASGDFSLAAGFKANAQHQGSMVLADSVDVDKFSSAVDEFSIFAEGGMRVLADGTTDPSLHVTSNGDVGIGTSAPPARLGVQSEGFDPSDVGFTAAEFEGVSNNNPGEFKHGGIAIVARGGGSIFIGSGAPGVRSFGGYALNGASGAGVEATGGAGGALGGAGVKGTGGPGDSLPPDTGGNGVEGHGGDSFNNGGNGVVGYPGIATMASNPGFGVLSQGDLGATGTKSFVQPHPTDPGREIRFVCLEGNESGTYFRGSSRIRNGQARIDVPEAFRLVSEPTSLTIQLTGVGRGELWVESKGLDEIRVAGDEDIEFDYLVNGVRRGFANVETMHANQTFRPIERGVPYGAHLRPEVRKMLVDNGLLHADFTPNEETALSQGWTLRDSSFEGDSTVLRDPVHELDRESADSVPTDSRARTTSASGTLSDR